MKHSQSLLILLLLSSVLGCTSYDSLLNYNEPPGIPTENQLISNYIPLRIQVNDRLQIGISSTDAAAIRSFVMGAGESNGGSAANEYLVDSKGYIDLPTIGQLQVTGMLLEEIKLKIKELLSPYLQQPPVVQVTLTNFRININGEVGRPGNYQIPNNRVSIIEAMSLAGDFTSYSRRDSILIIREEAGIRKFGYVDFNSSDLFSSPYFYLQQNDVIYVRPARTKVTSVRDPASRYLPWLTAAISSIALIFTITR